jgi:hypothetical protein
MVLPLSVIRSDTELKLAARAVVGVRLSMAAVSAVAAQVLYILYFFIANLSHPNSFTSIVPQRKS